MYSSSRVSELRVKFADRTWNETFQLVRRCMDKSRDESKPCRPIVESLERLREVFNVSSLNTTKSRLEVIAKQQGMGFHMTDATCYLTADLFHLEVLLLPCGGVEDVKVAPHAGSPVLSESLLQLLRSKHFAEFSEKLAGLCAQYNIPGDNEIRFKLFASLQCLRQDLEQMSNLQSVPVDLDSQMDLINNGRIGCLRGGKEDYPLTIQFYMSPAAYLQIPVVQAAQVTVGASDINHKLQQASVLPQPTQLDPQGAPVFLPLSEVSHEMLPAFFLLKLQPAIPITLSLVNKLSQITDIVIPEVGLQWAPLPKLLMRLPQHANSHEEAKDEQDAVFTVPLLGGITHNYVLPGVAWEVPAQTGTVVDSIPFTHPAHIPALLELLRHQCAFNTLLRTCMSSQYARTGLMCDLHYEVLPESETSFSVTFHRPDCTSLAVLLVNISDSHQISCTLFGAGIKDSSLDEYLSTVMKRCMSVPVTLRTLHSKLEKITTSPHSPHRVASSEAEIDHLAHQSPAATGNTMSQSASVPEDGFTVSACSTTSVAKPELPPEIRKCFSPYPLTPVEHVSTVE